MALSTWTIALTIGLMQNPAKPPVTAADVLTLRDGQVALGQVVEPAPRGKVVFLVRREWARTHIRDWAQRWEAAEAVWAHRAMRERRERLEAWKRERRKTGDQPDPIADWLDTEINRLKNDKVNIQTPLMAVQLSRNEVRSTTRRSPAKARLLRLGWLAGFEDVEMMTEGELTGALEARGFAPEGDDPAMVDVLLPIPPEPEALWLTRRAATEVQHERGLRFLRYQGWVGPEPEAGAAPDAALLLGSLKALLGNPPAEDPLAARARAVAAKGRVGLVVTQLAIAPDFSKVQVEITLWVRQSRDLWRPAVARSATIDPNTIPAGADTPLANDPQIKGIFELADALGLNQVAPDFKQRGLNLGAATQRALDQARAAFAQEMEALALPMDAPPEPAKEKAP
jgi:hypothetical protein